MSGPHGKNPNLRWPLYVLCVVVIAAAAYLRNYNCLYSLQMDGDTASTVHHDFAPHMAPTGGSFEPVMHVMYRMVVEAKGFRHPWDMRRLLLLLMTVDALLVFVIAMSLGLRLRWALAAGVTYLLHPMHNTNWSVSTTSHYLVAAFTMAGFLLHLEGRRNGMTALRLLGLAATCALSFCSKESGLVFPVLLWTYDFLVPIKGAGRTAVGRYLEHGLLIGLALGYLALRWTFFPQTDLSTVAAAISPGYVWERLLQALLMVRTPLIAVCLALLALGMSGRIDALAMRRFCFFGSWFLIGMLVYLAAPGYLVAFSGRYLVFPFAGGAWLVGAALDECESKLGSRWAGVLLLVLFCPVLLSPNPFCAGRASQLLQIERGFSLCGGKESWKGECLMSALSLPLLREKDFRAYQTFVDGLSGIFSPAEMRSFLRFFEIDFWSRGSPGREHLLRHAWVRMTNTGNTASLSAEIAEYYRTSGILPLQEAPPAPPPPAPPIPLTEPRALVSPFVLPRPEKAEPWITMVARATKAGDRAGALHILGQAERSTLSNDDKHLLALAYQGLRKFKDAQRLLESLVKERPLKAIYVNDRGLNKYLDGKEEEAIEDFQRAIELEPGFLPPYVSLGAILVSKNHSPEAVRLYDRALANASKNAPSSLLESIRQARNDALKRAGPAHQ